MADLGSQLRTGRLESFAEGGDGILLGREMARLLGVLPGESITVISPKGALTAVGMVPKMRRFTVAGTFEVGMHEFDSSLAYLPLAPAREFAGIPGVTGVEVKLDDPFDAKRVGRAVSAKLGMPYWVRDWMDLNRNLFNALQLEKLALFLVLAIISLVAAFAILGHLVLLVADKRKEIGILKSLGASRRSIAVVFFTVGMSIYTVGTVAGSTLGLLLIWVQNTFKIIRLAGDVYQIDYLPMRLTTVDFAMIVGVTLGLSFLATILPAMRAGNLNPVDVLRYE
jgi:lipoprotein-releasing system permease protein